MTTTHSRTVQTRRRKQVGKKRDARIAKEAKKLKNQAAKAAGSQAAKEKAPDNSANAGQ